ncbi:HAD family hydrolase [Flammeovirga sp. EKP202]|uniref:HAD family hydrolase n=1 Tax=Flammeovirga sp. EKP202 TaxID=2770592 RepID=UPI001CB81E96|nr:HAD family hydrolase [Flammeovirga sp. EKP202]
MEKYFVYIRPFLEEFINKVKNDYRLAVWSSAGDDYVNEIVSQLKILDNQLEFVWARSKCKRKYVPQMDEDGYYDTDPKSHYYFVKPLKKVKRKGYSLERILILDDTFRKSEENYGNAIYPTPYLGQEKDNELQKVALYLKKIKDVENFRSIEKRDWRERI